MISFIIPCFNEEDTIPAFYKAVIEIIKVEKYEYELIFVDDGSLDNTFSIIKCLAGQNVSVKYISFSRNFGKEAAIYAGLCNAKGDYIAVMDCDMQDPPSLIPKMYRMITEENYDCVATKRNNRKGEPPIRSFFAKAFYKIINRISDADIVDGARDFRLMKRKVADAIISLGEYNRFSKGIFGWVGFNTCWIEYENVERIAGDSKWSFWKLMKYAIDGIVSFSQTPLNITSYMGCAMTFFSFVMLVFIIIRKLIFDDPVSGWTSLVCIVIFIGGIQLFSLGVMGQYVAKTYMEVKHRPHYIINESNIQKSKLEPDLENDDDLRKTERRTEI